MSRKIEAYLIENEVIVTVCEQLCKGKVEKLQEDFENLGIQVACCLTQGSEDTMTTFRLDRDQADSLASTIVIGAIQVATSDSGANRAEFNGTIRQISRLPDIRQMHSIA